MEAGLEPGARQLLRRVLPARSGAGARFPDPLLPGTSAPRPGQSLGVPCTTRFAEQHGIHPRRLSQASVSAGDSSLNSTSCPSSAASFAHRPAQAARASSGPGGSPAEKRAAEWALRAEASGARHRPAASLARTASKMAEPVAAGAESGEAVQMEAGGETVVVEEDGPPESKEETLVFFDLETTGLEDNCDMVQLSAVSGEKIFDKFVVPVRSISEGASAINGFQVMDGVLYQYGEPKSTSSLRETMEAFLHFLKNLGTPLLIGHNIWKFDAPILLRVLEELSMKEQFAGCISGFLDTFWLAKNAVPRSEVKSYRQTELVQVFLKKAYKAHNAIEDAKSLQELYSVLKFTPEQKKSSQFSISQLECQVSLQPLLKEKIIFFQFADKLAMQGVSLEKLQSAHQQGGVEGLKKLLESLGHMERNYTRLSKFFSK